MNKNYLFEKSVQNTFVKAIKYKEGLSTHEDSTTEWGKDSTR